jgi:hypothetical protein
MTALFGFYKMDKTINLWGDVSYLYNVRIHIPFETKHNKNIYHNEIMFSTTA